MRGVEFALPPDASMITAHVRLGLIAGCKDENKKKYKLHAVTVCKMLRQCICKLF